MAKDSYLLGRLDHLPHIEHRDIVSVPIRISAKNYCLLEECYQRIAAKLLRRRRRSGRNMARSPLSWIAKMANYVHRSLLYLLDLELDIDELWRYAAILLNEASHNCREYITYNFSYFDDEINSVILFFMERHFAFLRRLFSNYPTSGDKAGQRSHRKN